MDGKWGAVNRLTWKLGRRGIASHEYAPIIREMHRAVPLVANWEPIERLAVLVREHGNTPEMRKQWLDEVAHRVDYLADKVKKLHGVRPTDKALMNLHMASYAWGNNHTKRVINEVKAVINADVNSEVATKAMRDADFHREFLPIAQDEVEKELVLLRRSRPDLAQLLDLPELDTSM